jgi:hypothetical protein
VKEKNSGKERFCAIREMQLPAFWFYGSMQYITGCKKTLHIHLIFFRCYYTAIYAPLHRYEDFRKVINAAADFNKVTLVLEKLK